MVRDYVYLPQESANTFGYYTSYPVGKKLSPQCQLDVFNVIGVYEIFRQ